MAIAIAITRATAIAIEMSKYCSSYFCLFCRPINLRGGRIVCQPFIKCQCQIDMVLPFIKCLSSNVVFFKMPLIKYLLLNAFYYVLNQMPFIKCQCQIYMVLPFIKCLSSNLLFFQMPLIKAPF